MTNAIAQIGDAALGWLAMVAGHAEGKTRFVGTPTGLAIALVFYALVVILGLALQSLDMGVLDATTAVTGLAINALPLVGIYLGLLVTRLMLRPASGILQMMVAAIYALGFLLVVALPLALFGVSLSSAILGVLAFALYRGGRLILGLSVPSSIAYSALSIVLLVALPLSLYMLISPGPGGPI